MADKILKELTLKINYENKKIKSSKRKQEYAKSPINFKTNK